MQGILNGEQRTPFAQWQSLMLQNGFLCCREKFSKWNMMKTRLTLWHQPVFLVICYLLKASPLFVHINSNLTLLVSIIYGRPNLTHINSSSYLSLGLYHLRNPMLWYISTCCRLSLSLYFLVYIIHWRSIRMAHINSSLFPLVYIIHCNHICAVEWVHITQPKDQYLELNKNYLVDNINVSILVHISSPTFANSEWKSVLQSNWSVRRGLIKGISYWNWPMLSLFLNIKWYTSVSKI